jgi:hypothetical protein
MKSSVAQGPIPLLFAILEKIKMDLQLIFGY